MTAGLISEALAPLRADPARGAVLLDIDGTLAPIVEHASEAHVPETTRQLLIEVSRRYAIVACVSGRQASEARAMVSIGSISYLGSHGAELLRAGATVSVLDPGVEQWARRIHEFGRDADTPDLRRARVRIEDKGVIVAFHWRGAADEEAAKSAVDALAARAEAAGFGTHWGRKVLEVRPPIRFDKGAGIEAFLDGAEVDTAMYVGDDSTDVDAFRGLTRLVETGRIERAIKVGVASEEAPAAVIDEADIVVDGTAGVARLLAALVADE